MGSTIGLWIAYHLERYYRHRREVRKYSSLVLAIKLSTHLPSSFYRPKISLLYRPLDTQYLSDPEDEEETNTQLLPTNGAPPPASKGKNKSIRLTDVWDEREELFGLGSDSDNEDDGFDAGTAAARRAYAQPGTGGAGGGDGHSVPKIVVSNS